MATDRSPKTSPDSIVTVGSSTIQHGRYNDRIYLMKLSAADCPQIIPKLNHLATQEGYSRITAKIPLSKMDRFLRDGYMEEARVPGFFNGTEDAVFVAKFMDDERARESRSDHVADVLKACQIKQGIKDGDNMSDFHFRPGVRRDTAAIADLYERVFETYPFPIYEQSFISQAMENDVIYFTLWADDQIVSASAAEITANDLNVEMTNFATLSQYRNRGCAVHLLDQMEETVRRRAIRTAYTIARAYSYGMNLVFARCGYSLAGTLVNNSNISGAFESMNVWYKAL